MRNVSLTTNKAKQNKKLDSGAANTVKSNTQTNNNSTTTTTTKIESEIEINTNTNKNCWVSLLI